VLQVVTAQGSSKNRSQSLRPERRAACLNAGMKTLLAVLAAAAALTGCVVVPVEPAGVYAAPVVVSPGHRHHHYRHHHRHRGHWR
jgi:hypothetical protein